MNNNRLKHYVIAIFTVLVTVILDQWTKHLAVLHLKDQEPFIILDGIFQLRYLENRGAAFGLMQNQRMFFYISTFIIAIMVIWFYAQVPMTKKYLPLRICSIFVLSGGIGNFIDRIRLNYVVDFFYFELIDFPIFNVADIFASVATVALIFLVLFYYKDEEFDVIFRTLKLKKEKTQE